jgi:hypothetical protein
VGFHGREATHKPNITMRNAKRQLASGVLETFSEVMNHGFGGCQDNAICSNA